MLYFSVCPDLSPALWTLARVSATARCAVPTLTVWAAARVRRARVLVTRDGAGACVTSDSVTPGVRSMVSVSMGAVCVNRAGMADTAAWMDVAETAGVMESVARSGSPETITMSGGVSARQAGAVTSVDRDRRQSVKTRWTMIKVRFPSQPPCPGVVLFTAINKWAEKCPKFNI